MSDAKTVTFRKAIPYGDKELKELNLRRPLGGDLRGVSIRAIHDMEWDEIVKLTERIATPQVTAGQLAALDAVSCIDLTTAVVDFFNG